MSKRTPRQVITFALEDSGVPVMSEDADHIISMLDHYGFKIVRVDDFPRSAVDAGYYKDAAQLHTAIFGGSTT